MRSKTKVMLLACFDSEDIVHHEYAPDGQTINKEFYVEVLRRLRESVRRKRPEKWRDGDWILHHDNAPAHILHLVQQFLAKHGTAQLQQPPYSPDVAPCDFFLFPRLKRILKGRRFKATGDIKRNSTKTLLDILKDEFAKCFQQWQKCWSKCVAAEGNYVEDSYGQIPVSLIYFMYCGQSAYFLYKPLIINLQVTRICTLSWSFTKNNFSYKFVKIVV